MATIFTVLLQRWLALEHTISLTVSPAESARFLSISLLYVLSFSQANIQELTSYRSGVVGSSGNANGE